MRKGLGTGERKSPPLPRFEVKPKACGFGSGVDVLRLNQRNDQLETEDFQRKLSKDTVESLRGSKAPGGGVSG